MACLGQGYAGVGLRGVHGSGSGEWNGQVEGKAWVRLRAVTSLGTLVMMQYDPDGFLHIDTHCADTLTSDINIHVDCQVRSTRSTSYHEC